MKCNPADYALVEANLNSLSARLPDVPVNGILIVRLMLLIAREISVMLEQQIRPFGLTEAEFRVLSTLFSQPDGVAHPSDLCARASQSPANMSRISDALVSRGLITRWLSVSDRRRMDLRITAQGENLVRELLPQMFVPLRSMLQGFCVAEQEELIGQLKTIGLQLGPQMTPEAP